MPANGRIPEGTEQVNPEYTELINNMDIINKCIDILHMAGYRVESQLWSDRNRCHMWGLIIPERMANGGYQRITVNLDDLKDEAKLYE